MSNNLALKVLLNAVDRASNTLSGDERRLNDIMSEMATEFHYQSQSWERVDAQKKIDAVNARYESGKALTAGVRNVANAGVDTATAGVEVATTVLKPGYDLSLKTTELQAVLGLEKESPEMAALKAQARQLGDTSSVSPADAAAAQVIVAKAGADKDGVLAQTPAILNLSLLNKETVADNAKLLMATKSAFGLADDKAAHIADVISATMSQSAVTFAGLSDSLASVGSTAKDAGVSLEQTAAMIGALHDAKVTGPAAGSVSKAVISRLQAPTGKAADAMTALGVKTTDSDGNTRPVFTILKEIQASFASHKLGSGERSEYTKTIFGEAASPSASVLMAAADSGKLDSLTELIGASNGKTAQLIALTQNNLGGDFSALQSAYEAVGTDLYDQQESSLRKLVQTATGYVLSLDSWIQKNQELTQAIGLIAGGALTLIGVVGGIAMAAWPVIAGINIIIAAAGLLGTVFTVVGGAIAMALGAISMPVVVVTAAIVAGALLIRQFWEPVSAILSGVAEGFMVALEPIRRMFAGLAPYFEALNNKLNVIRQWFSDVIAPISATEDTLNRCREAGVLLGKSLGEILLTPINAFSTLSDKVSGLLEKLGIINKESSTLDKAAAKINAIPRPNTPSDTALLDNSTLSPSRFSGGDLAYQPASAPKAGRSFIDQSRSEYHFTLQGGMAGDSQIENRIREALERLEEERRSKNYGSMVYD